MQGKGSPAINLILVFGSWLVPGLGFMVKGNYWRGATVFVVLNGTFFLGLLLHGTVLVPEFNYRSPAFNVVNLLTFIGQMGNGGASAVCLARDKWKGERPAEDVETRRSRPDPFKRILHKTGDALRRVLPPARETDALFDLALLFMLVSGCMNYFCVCNFYDRYLGPAPDAEPARDKS